MTNTTTTTKLTKAQKFDMLLAIEEVKSNPILVEFINHEKELIAKKNAADRKPTKNQIANTALGQKILDIMEDNTLYTVSQILKMLDDETLNQSKVSAVVRGMLTVTANGVVNPNGTIERIMEKGVALFRKVETNTDTEEEEEG
jgi:hypothetical protein